MKSKSSQVVVHEFSASIFEIINAIAKDEQIDGINLAEKIHDPAFRFVSTSDRETSASLSDIFANLLEKGRTDAAKLISNKATVKRQENADEFAKNMYGIVERLRDEKQASSYRDIVKALNDENIPTYSVKKNNKNNDAIWHLSMYQLLQKRWKNLGLIDDKQSNSSDFTPS